MRVKILIFLFIFLPFYLMAGYCDFCGSLIVDKKLCPYCKNSLQKDYSSKISCPVCESINSSKNRYCTNCGYPLKFLNEEFKNAVIEFNKGNYKSSLNLLNKILKEDRFFYYAYEYKIEILYKNGNLSNFYSEIKNRLRIEKDDLPTLFVMGLLYYKNGEKVNSISTFKDALKIYPEFSEAYYELYKITGEFEYLKRAIEYKSSFYLPYISYAEYFVKDKKYEDAKDYIDKAFKLFPYDYRIYYIKGRIKIKENDISKETLNFFKKSLEYNPGFIPAKYYTGKLYYLQNDILKSLDTFKEILTEKEVEQEIYMLSNFYIGLIYDRVNNFDLFNINLAESRNYLKYYEESFNNLSLIKDFIYATTEEYDKILLLRDLTEFYKNKVIDSNKYLEERRIAIFKK